MQKDRQEATELREIWISGLVLMAVYTFYVNMKCEIRKQSLECGLEDR